MILEFPRHEISSLGFIGFGIETNKDAHGTREDSELKL